MPPTLKAARSNRVRHAKRNTPLPGGVFLLRTLACGFERSSHRRRSRLPASLPISFHSKRSRSVEFCTCKTPCIVGLPDDATAEHARTPKNTTFSDFLFFIAHTVAHFFYKASEEAPSFGTHWITHFSIPHGLLALPKWSGCSRRNNQLKV